MQKRIRVLKNLPFAKAGTVEEWDKEGFFRLGGEYKLWESTDIQRWIDDGWLEWVVEEKSLREKIQDWFNHPLYTPGYMKISSTVAAIAERHYLEIYDKAAMEEGLSPDSPLSKAIRRALESGGE